MIKLVEIYLSFVTLTAKRFNFVLKFKLPFPFQEVAEVLPKLVQGVKSTMMDVDNPSSQLALISSCEMMLQVFI